MHEIILAYNTELIEEALDNEQCVDPTVFKARDGDYQLFADYAQEIGRGNEWVEWSEDESCSQRSVDTDAEADAQWTDFCDIAYDITDIAPPIEESGCGEVTWEGYCDGSTVVWCSNDEIQTYDCDGTCAWDDYYDYYWCSY